MANFASFFFNARRTELFFGSTALRPGRTPTTRALITSILAGFRARLTALAGTALRIFSAFFNFSFIFSDLKGYLSVPKLTQIRRKPLKFYSLANQFVGR